MDDATLRERLWLGFARLQTLLGGQAAGGEVLERPGHGRVDRPDRARLPDAERRDLARAHVDDEILVELELRFLKAGVRRWGVWVDGGSTRRRPAPPARRPAPDVLLPRDGGRARRPHAQRPRARRPPPTSPPSAASTTSPTATRTAAWSERSRRCPEGALRAYRADHRGRPAAVALALHHDEDCGVSFVATAPNHRRHGHATDVMHRVLIDAREHGCTTTSLQATELGEKLYVALGYRIVSTMQLWEHR